MSSILQKLRHANHLLLLHKCTSDDNLSVPPDVTSKLISISYDGSIASRFIAMTLFEKLTKRSSTLSTKILPVICSIIRHGSSDFKQEIRQKLYILKQLQESSLKCQGEQVHELFKELIELLEGDKCKGLLESEPITDQYRESKCMTVEEVQIKLPDHTSTLSVVAPEVNIVQQITAPSCIDILPPMVDIWKFSSSYKNLNQTRVNEALVDVLQHGVPSAKLKALAVLDYLTQQFPESLGDQFNTIIEEMVHSDNIDLRTKAKNVHTKLTQRPVSQASSSFHSSPPPAEVDQCEQRVAEENLCRSHTMKKSYDKLATVKSRYLEDEPMLDLRAPDRRASASSMDFLLEPI